MPSQINVPSSATSPSPPGWSTPSNWYVNYDENCAESARGADASGHGLVIEYGSFPTTAAATVTFAIQSIYTDVGVGDGTVNAWISPDGSTKAGAAISVSIPQAPYESESTRPQISSPISLNGTLTGIQAASGAYLILEKTSTGENINLDYITLEATWTNSLYIPSGSIVLPPYGQRT